VPLTENNNYFLFKKICKPNAKSDLRVNRPLTGYLISVSCHLKFSDGASTEVHHAVDDRIAEHLQPPVAQNAEGVHHEVAMSYKVSFYVTA
jgi:hypothetical protein